MKDGIQMEEKDILQDILVLEKDIVKTYGSYIIESSCEKMRSLLTDNMSESAEGQFEVFEAMNTRGYYPVEDAPAQKVQQAKTQFKGILKNLS